MFLFPLLPRTRTGSPFLLLSVFLIPWWISTATADPILDDPVLREYQNAEQTLPSRQPREEILPLPDFETSRQPAPARPSTRQAASPAAPLPVERVGSVDEIPLLTVIDLETNTLEPSETGVVTQVVWNAIQRAGHARLMRLQGSRQLLAEQDLTPSDPYRPPPPRDAVARALHADYLILGNVNRFQGAYALDLILYSAVLDSIVHSATVVTDEGGKFLLEKEIPAAVADLLRAVPRRALGPVSRDSRNGPSVPPGLLGREVEQLRLENERLREQLRRMEGPSTGFEPSTGAELNEDLPQLNPVQYGDKKYKTPGKTPIHIGEYEPEPDPSPESEESHVTMVAEAHTPTPEPTARPTPEPTPEPAHEDPPAPEPEPTPPLSPAPRAEDKARAKALYREANALPDDSSEAIEPLERAISLDPSEPVYQQALVQRLFQNGLYSRAAREGEQYVRRGNENPLLLIYLSAAWSQLGDYRRALDAADHALRVDPTNGYALYNRALNLLQLGDETSAIQGFRTFLEKTENRPEFASYRQQAQDLIAQIEGR